MIGLGSSKWWCILTVAGVTAASLAACDVAPGASSFGGGFSNDSPQDGNNPSEPTFALGNDGAAPATDTYRGSSLCKIVDTRCVPDDDGRSTSMGGKACPAGVDGGDGDAASAVEGCRLGKDEKGVIVPGCKSAGTGGDGTSCETGADCAPGFDCVAGGTSFVCRRYCCLGSCDSQSSQNGGATFCDVQRLADGNTKAPVCMPLKHCALLGSGECAETETCTVVNENGDTGCVANGDAQVGQSCDETHCSAGLSCLGQAGNRKCYQLCKLGSSTCGMQQTCKTSTLFKDQSVGICSP